MTSPLEKLSFALLCALLVALGTLAPIHQAASYHLFADAQSWGGLHNGANVLSNLAFVAVGLWGLHQSDQAPEALRGSLDLFFIGLVLTGLGSAAYHWAPDNQTLIWDRLPMTIAFAGAMGALAYQHLGPQAVRRWQNAWLYAGPVSVAIWALGGDLRLYVVVQFGGLLVGSLWMAVSALNKRAAGFALPWHWVWGGYALAKACEHADAWVWQLSSELVSGHVLKHLVAALAVVPVVRALKRHG